MAPESPHSKESTAARFEAAAAGTRWRKHRVIALAGAAVLLLSAIVALVRSVSRPELPAAVADFFRAYKTQRTRLDFSTSNGKALEAYFASHGVDFPMRVFDLGIGKYHLLGGRVAPGRNEPIALVVYRGANDRILMGEMFSGRLSDLPAETEARQHNGFRFHIYRKGEVTAVFWREGAIVCALLSDGPREDVVQLAFANAIAP